MNPNKQADQGQGNGDTLGTQTTGGDRGGEGNYDAAERYNKGVEQSVKQGNSAELAEKAKKALEGSEGDELRRADEKGKNAETPQKN